MKSFFLFTFLTVAVSIACSGYKSAGSPSVSNITAATNQVATQNESALPQDNPKCDLTVASVPAINGIKLGMTTDEILALFPGSKDDTELRADLSRPPNRFGSSSFIIRPAIYKNGAKFVPISQVTFMFLDGRVYNFTIGYNGPEYAHVDKFVSKFVEGSSLPAADQWQAYVGLDTQMKTLTCTDFEVTIFAGGPGGNLNYVSMRDLEADKMLKDRKTKAKAQPTPVALPKKS